MASEATLKKIRNLLDLAQGTKNLNEAAVAFATAQQLLLKHNLTQAQVEATTGFKEADEAIVNSNDPLYVGQRVVLWKDYLANKLSELNSCKMYINTSYVPEDPRDRFSDNVKVISYRVVGRPSDVEMVRYFFNSIVTQIEYLSAAALKAGLGRGKTFTNNFKHGAAEVVVRRLQEMNQSVRAEHSQAYGIAALVLVDQKAEAVEKWAEDHLKLKPRKITYQTAGDVQGYLAGRKAGEKVSLNKGMEAATKSENPKLNN
jgi:hypothetical protein